MGKEIPKQVNKHRIKDSIEDLLFMKELLKVSKHLIICGELEIEPFTEFSVAFQAEYWYLKYQLVITSEVELEGGDFESLYEEKNINVVWLSIKDEKGLTLDCIDGDWYISYKTLDEDVKAIANRFELIPSLTL